MKKLILLLPTIFLVFASSVLAQVTLNTTDPVNSQIDGSETTYLAESGEIYYFDGTLEVDFDLQILGPDGDTWIKEQAEPPVFIQLPASDGSARDMINLLQGGSVELRNSVFSGLMNNDEILISIVNSDAGNKIILDNNIFSDVHSHVVLSAAPLTEFTITNNLFINLDRRGASPFGGMPFRLNTEAEQLTFENNTVVNAARLMGNGGEFFTSNMTEIHNTVLNQQVTAHELHWGSALQANNIYYNWSWRGRDLRTNGYEAPFTTWVTHANVKTKLDSISLYQGFNAFYLDPAIKEYWETEINPQREDDSAHVRQNFLWNVDVDSTLLAHDELGGAEDDFTIGKNYWQFDPEFTTNPTNIDSMNAWNLANWTEETHYPDWRIPSAVTYPGEGQIEVNLPLDLDLSYANDTLLTAGTDGLPLGDLNWFPDAKADYEANRDAYISALQDSMTSATFVYNPGDSLSAFITSSNVPVGIETVGNSNVPKQFFLSDNYPNPFNPSTTINFGLPVRADVNLSVFNVLGQKVFEFDRSNLQAGGHQVRFDASQLSSGMYIYRIQATGSNGKSYVSSKKMMLIK